MSVKHSPAYIAATVIRAGALGVWGLAVPALLSVTDYGVYGVLATTVMLAAQLSMLGAPQTLVANPTRQLPVAGLAVHSTLLALVVGGVLVAVLPSVGMGRYGLIVAGTMALVAYKLAGARARSALAFRATLASEAAVATTFLIAGITMEALRRGCGARCPSGNTAVIAEALAFGMGALVLVVAPSLRPSREELSIRGVRPWLPWVYSIGLLSLLDVVLLRRIEVYFLELSPDGLPGVAAFSLAAQFGSMIQLLPVAMIETWQPQLARLWESDREGFAQAFHRIQRIHLLLTGGLFLAGVPIAMAAVFVGFTKYQPWLVPIALITAARIFFVATALYSGTLYAIGRYRFLYRPVAIGAATAVAANAALTLRLGLSGAVGAVVIAQVVLSWLTWRAFGRATAPETRTGR